MEKVMTYETLQPFHSNEIPDEMAGLEFANQAARTITGENKYGMIICKYENICGSFVYS